MSGFPVGKDKEKKLLDKMKRFGVKETDILEKFTRSSGPGGQNVNKNSTCVYLKHIPTGIEIKCQIERSQGKNRYIARKLLLDKIESRLLGIMSQERQRIEKIKRQKRKRSKRAKLKILQMKQKRSEKKHFRSKIIEI